MNSVQQGFYEVDCAGPSESYCLQLDAKLLMFVAIEHWGRTNSLSGEMSFLGRSNVDEKRGFSGV
jgi:hypothetical protein